METKTKSRIILGGKIVAGIMAMSIFMRVIRSHPKEVSTQTPVQIAMSKMDPIQAMVKCERYIKNSLRDPDSYDRVGYNVWIVDTLERKMGVYIKFRAKNGFGGLNEEKYLFTVDSNFVPTHSQ